MDDHAFASATSLAAAIRDRRVGCVELLDLYLARAERFNPALNAVIAWQVDEARARARKADAALAKGELWGPLHGVPMTVKESYNVKGLKTTFGNPAFRDNVATSNSVVVDWASSRRAVTRRTNSAASSVTPGTSSSSATTCS
jgi:amidase